MKEIRTILISLWDRIPRAKTDSIRQDSTKQPFTSILVRIQMYRLSPGNVDEEILSFAGYQKTFRGTTFKFRKLRKFRRNSEVVREQWISVYLCDLTV